MRKLLRSTCLILLMLGLGTEQAEAQAQIRGSPRAADARPNIILILADDK
jgi:hypothetical protein